MSFLEHSFRPRKALIASAILGLWSFSALATERSDSLHEGHQVEVGVRTVRTREGALQAEEVLAFSGDFALVPILGQALKSAKNSA